MKLFTNALIVSASIFSTLCTAETSLVFCENPESSDSCQTEAATDLAKKFPDYFQYKQDLMTIKSGEHKINFPLDKPLTYESEDEKRISLDSYFPELNWLVTREIYDGGESIGYRLIDIAHQLKTTELAARPIPAADNKHFLNFGIDLEAGFTLNGLVLYKINSNGEIKEVYRHDDSWGVASAEWISPVEVNFVTRAYCDSEAREDLCDQKMKLEYKNNTWITSKPK